MKNFLSSHSTIFVIALNISVYIMASLMYLILLPNDMSFFVLLAKLAVMLGLFIASDIIYSTLSQSKFTVLIWLISVPLTLFICYLIYTPDEWFSKGYSQGWTGIGSDHPIYQFFALFFERGSALYSAAYNTVMVFLIRLIPFTIARFAKWCNRKFGTASADQSDTPEPQKTNISGE